MQLKTRDSYKIERRRDGVEILQIKRTDWAEDWQQREFPVMVVICGNDGAIRWMNVSSYLNRESNDGKGPVNQIVFEGEQLDAMSVRRWRDEVFGQAST